MMRRCHMLDETGVLTRDGGSFVLQRDGGGRIALELGRVPVDLVEKRVRIVGAMLPDGRIAVEGVQPA